VAKGAKKKVKKNVQSGIAHIQSTFNNTIITFTDPGGAALCWATSSLAAARSSRLIGSWATLGWVMLIGTLVAVPATLLWGGGADLTPAALQLLEGLPDRGTPLEGQVVRQQLGIEVDHGQRDKRPAEQHGAERQGIAEEPFELRHDIEIHAVEAGDEGEGNEDGGDHRQHPDDFVQAVADCGEIDLHLHRHHFSVGLQ